MATLSLRHFTNLDSLRSITPKFLLRMLWPHRAFFAERGLQLPEPDRGVEPPYETLQEILINPEGAPSSLVDGLFFANELATPEGMDALLDELREREITIDDGDDPTPIDVAIQAWLVDPDILQEKHAEQHLVRPRSFEYFQTTRTQVPDFELPSAATRKALEVALDAWFSEHKRGTGARVFIYPRDDGVWFLVRHGDPFRREGSMDGGEPGSVAFRPMKFDVLVYDPRIGEIRMNAGTVGEKTLYREQFGRHFFGDSQLFPGTGKYTLTPLQEDGDASLVCGDVDGIDWVRLKEVHFYWGGAEGEIEVRKAKNVFAAYARRGAAFPTRVRIIKAVFEVKFSDSKTPRSVAIRPSNIAQYTRDHDSANVEVWLAKRGFIIAREMIANANNDAVLAGA